MALTPKFCLVQPLKIGTAQQHHLCHICDVPVFLRAAVNLLPERVHVLPIGKLLFFLQLFLGNDMVYIGDQFCKGYRLIDLFAEVTHQQLDMQAEFSFFQMLIAVLLNGIDMRSACIKPVGIGTDQVKVVAVAAAANFVSQAAAAKGICHSHQNFISHTTALFPVDLVQIVNVHCHQQELLPVQNGLLINFRGQLLEAAAGYRFP